MRTYEEDLQAAAAYHGHLCAGMFIGVRMARYALKLLGIEEPLKFKDLIVYVEIDRCASDAVCVVTGCTLGRKRLKLVNYGKMAATFVNIATNEAIRLAAVGNKQPLEGGDSHQFWAGFRDEELFKAEKVAVDILPRCLAAAAAKRLWTPGMWSRTEKFYVWPAAENLITGKCNRE